MRWRLRAQGTGASNRVAIEVKSIVRKAADEHNQGTAQVMTRMHQMKRFWRPLQAAALALLLLGLSIGVGAAQGTSTSKAREHVYLMRGAFNVFSLGLDDLGAKLQRLGINVSVENYLAWSRIVDEAAAEYKSGRVQNIIVIGHSSGATAVTAVAARLGELGVPVKLAIGLDPTTRTFAAGHVDRYINYYAPGGMGTVVDKGRDFHGVLQNVSITTAGHFDIDKNQALQDRVIADIRAALARPAPRAPTTQATRAAPADASASVNHASMSQAYGQDRRQ
jgi:pimeloyl-ACP methyl ester carboxylesterase